MASENVLEVKNLSKRYGNFEAVRGIDFTVSRGEIFALIGPNGAGKTTTLRVVATLLEASGGDATVDGISVRDRAHGLTLRSKITYLPDEAGAYKNMRGHDYLRFMARLCTPERAAAEQAVAFAAEVCGLGERLNEKISAYSKGMTRKLLIARAVMTKPSLAILDEPTSGLDIVNGLEIRDLLKRLAADEGMSFLISGHNMLEIEYISARVGIIDRGTLHAVGTPAELKERFRADNLEEVFVRAVAAGEAGEGAV